MTDTLVTSVRTGFEKTELRSQECRGWLAMVVPTSNLRTQRLKQEFKFQATLIYIMILCLKRKNKIKQKNKKNIGTL